MGEGGRATAPWIIGGNCLPRHCAVLFRPPFRLPTVHAAPRFHFPRPHGRRDAPPCGRAAPFRQKSGPVFALGACRTYVCVFLIRPAIAFLFSGRHRTAGKIALFRRKVIKSDRLLGESVIGQSGSAGRKSEPVHRPSEPGAGPGEPVVDKANRLHGKPNRLFGKASWWSGEASHLSGQAIRLARKASQLAGKAGRFL